MASNITHNIAPFVLNGAENFEDWLERLEMSFLANGVADQDKKKASLISLGGPELYKLAKSLTSPHKPSEKTFDELKNTLQEHLNPKGNIIMERFKFNSRVREQGESVSDFIAELRRLSRTCEYGTSVNDMIRDRLVVGIAEISIQRKLLSEEELTLDKASKIAIGMETAGKHAAAISNIGGAASSSDIHGIGHEKKTTRCFRCGKVHT